AASSMPALNERTSLYIPAHVARRNDITALLTAVTASCGGVTITDTRGAWVSDATGELVYEPVAVYTWWHTSYSVAIERVHGIIRIMLNDGKQDAVLPELLRQSRLTARVVRA